MNSPSPVRPTPEAQTDRAAGGEARSCALSAAILAGGQSRRMGVDKALVSLEPDGAPLLAHVLSRCQQISDDCFIVASDRPEYGRFAVPVEPDRFPGTGALGGIATALARAKHDRCLIVGCDHPFLSTELVSAMAAVEGDWDVIVPVLPGTSRQGGTIVRQTLHAIYRQSCLPAIEEALGAGLFQVISFFPSVRVREIDEATCRRYDANLRSFFSVNTPEALAVAASWARSVQR